LEEMRRLINLGLGGTPVTDKALAYLASMSTLEALNVYRGDNNIGPMIADAGFVHLAGIQRLRRLNLMAGSASEEGIKKLTKVLPELVLTEEISYGIPSRDSS